MKEFLFLFHSTVGVIQTRKALQAAGSVAGSGHDFSRQRYSP